jgi:hypothetical protein
VADKPFGHARVEVDRQLLERAAVYHGAILRATAAGVATATVYDGLGVAGEPIDAFRAGANEHDFHMLDPGVALREGLFIDLGDNIDFFTVYYEPRPRSAR